MNKPSHINSNQTRWRRCLFAIFAQLLVGSCLVDSGESEDCGPAKAMVTRVIDGDTVEIENGERVRYLLIDTPELDSGDCFADQATELNADLVLGKELSFQYEEVCRDDFGRLLAFASIGDRSINETLLERGYACTLYIPPNGEESRERYQMLMSDAKSNERGMWSACESISCL